MKCRQMLLNQAQVLPDQSNHPAVRPMPEEAVALPREPRDTEQDNELRTRDHHVGIGPYPER